MLNSIREKVNYFSQHWFVKNTALLQLGSFAGTLTQAVTGVLLARILQPELFGIYALSFGVAGLASLFLGGGAQDAISAIAGETYTRGDVSRTREALAYLVKVSFFAALFAMMIAMWAPLVTQTLYGNGLIGWYATVIITAAALSTLFFSVTSLSLQISGQIKSLALLTMADQVLRFGLSLLFAFLGGGIFGAVSGHLAGSLIIFFASLYLWRRMQKKFPILPSISELIRQVRNVPFTKYLRFSLWITVDRNIATLFATLPVLMTGIFIAPAGVAFFKLAFGYLNIALSLLGPISILLNVEFPRMKVIGFDQMKRSFIKVSLYSLILTSVLALGVVAISPVAFGILYGPEFRASVPYVFGLFLYGALFGIGVGLGPMWRAVNKVKISILINAITLAAGIPIGFWLIKNYGIWGSVAMVTIWFTVSHMASFIYLTNKLRSI